jgi:LysR family hydrogen peroxide-inducible transcriptional activator
MSICSRLASEKIWLLEEENCLRDHFSGLTLLPELYYLDLPLDKKEKTIDFAAPYPVREVSLIYYRPYAKLRLVNALMEEIRRIIPSLLESASFRNSDMQIVQI